MADILRFDGKVVLVTGAGGGIGKAYALAFAERGAKVVVNDLGGSMKGEGKSSNMADLVVKEIKAKGGEAVANYDSVEDGEKVIKTALDNYGRIDILINNAGILRDRSFARTSDLDWDLVHRVHLRGSFLVTRAAWDHMKKNKYGKIIMTTSSSGLYGNFGQANYAAAKMGVVGLSNTLAIEGRKYNISCNAIGPIAGSRLTETVMPKELVAALKPDYLAPIVLWLCHDTCEETGNIYEGGAGYFSQTRFQKSRGVVVARKNQPLTAEDVRDNWEQICNFDKDATYPKSSGESSARSNEALIEIEEQAEAESKPAPAGNGRPDSVIGAELPEGALTWTNRDAILYALGVGFSTQHKDFLKFLFEMNEDFSMLPMFGAIIGSSGMRGLVAGDLPVSIDPTQILHGEQYTELVKPLPTSGSLTSKARVADVLDKGRGAVFVVDVDSYDDNGDLVVRNQSSIYVQRMGGYGGKRKSEVAKEPVDPPKRSPDASVEEKTSIDQAAIYRLSGDYNPLHIDPAFAAMGGFDRPILHGLCSFGYSGKHVLAKYCNNDPTKFKAIKVRFSKPVLPGQTLRTDMWKEGSRVFFQTTVVENGNVCLTGAYVDIVDTGAPAESTSASDGQSLQSDLIFLEIQNRIKSKPNLIKTVKAIFQWNITQDGKVVKSWTVDLKNAPGSVYEGEPKGDKAGVTLTLSDQDFIDMASGKLNGQQAFFSGKVKIKGNIMLSQKLEGIFKEESKL